MEFIFSFRPSYFSIIFLAKCKISKSVSLFLSHIGSKWCLPIRLQDFKSNISLEQSDEIASAFLHVDTRNLELVEKYWVSVVRNGYGHPELIFCMQMQIQES